MDRNPKAKAKGKEVGVLDRSYVYFLNLEQVDGWQRIAVVTQQGILLGHKNTSVFFHFL